MRAKVQQNLGICKFYVEKVLGGIKVRYFLAGRSVRAPHNASVIGDLQELDKWQIEKILL